MKPCKRGHAAKRTKDGHCPACARLRTQIRRPAIKAYMRQRDINTPQRASAAQACFRAKKQGAPYNLQFLVELPCPALCPVLGTPISFARGVGRRPRECVASFDQIIPRGGYAPGNVRIISELANQMLNSGTHEQRIRLALWILKQGNK